MVSVDRVECLSAQFHSQAGGFGFTVAQARPDKIKVIIAVEPAVASDKALAGKLKDIPVLVVYATTFRSTAGGRRGASSASTMPRRCARRAGKWMGLICPRPASRETPTC